MCLLRHVQLSVATSELAALLGVHAHQETPGLKIDDNIIMSLVPACAVIG